MATVKGHSYVLIPLLLLVSLYSHAQTIVKGKVVDATSREPLPGASVRITDIKTGTLTDAEGNFALSATRPLPQTITVSYVGYQVFIAVRISI